MLGRRLDRYVANFFVWHFLVCLLGVMGLYLLVDTFAHLDEFVEHGSAAEQARQVVVYHVYQIPVLLGRFLPVVVLLGAIISLSRLSAYNELNAMKAAGVSVHRTLLPVFVVAGLIGLLGAADQEMLVPRLEKEILDSRDRTIKDHDTYHDLFVFDEKARQSVMARTLLNAAYGFTLRRVEVRPPLAAAEGAEQRPAPLMRAERALWVHRWVFLFDGEATAADGEAPAGPTRTLRADAKAADFTPALEPEATLGDGTAAHVVGARLGDRAVELAFADFENLTRQRLILRGQITSVTGGQPDSAPIDIDCALWRPESKRWIGHGQTYRQVTAEKRELKVYDAEPLPMRLRPQDLIQSRTDPTLKSIPELLRLADRLPMLRQRILLDLYTRMALPVASVVLLLVAVPLLFQQEGGKCTLLGVGLALFVAMGFYVVTFAFQAIGRDPSAIFGDLPWLAAWLPTLIFGAAGAVLLYNMDT
ncbi:MAG: LptF/LptG family permease [Planctomycetota bacterium]